MRINHQAGFAAICGLVFSSYAFSQTNCDCTSIIGSCSASVTAETGFYEVTSDAAQCARVDYLVNGTPFVDLVVDGAARRLRTAESGSPAIIVQSCQVCLASSVESDAPAFGAGLFSEGEATRLIEVAPAYPNAALAAGIEGFVELRFTITPTGTVAAPEVLSSEPAGVFENAAIAAVSRWRYTSNLEGEPQTVTERIEFNLADGLFSLGPGSASTPQMLQVSAPRRNSCIQEETRFDFGAEIGISLINACEQPLVVYSCAAGTGSDFERWICRNPREPGITLGSSAISAGRATGSDQPGAASRLEITRAPNSEYWWLACDINDTDCQSDGRQWVRSMDRQIATIDPQDRTRARLARSY
jgi:TonB family protein